MIQQRANSNPNQKQQEVDYQTVLFIDTSPSTIEQNDTSPVTPVQI